MGCSSTRERKDKADLQNLLRNYETFTHIEGLTLHSLALDKKNEDKYFEFYSKALSNISLDPKVLQEKKKKKESLAYPFYIFAWKLKDNIVAAGSIYIYFTFSEKVATLRDILVDKSTLDSEHHDFILVEANLVKSLISIAFEVEKADVLLYEGDPDTFKEIVPQSTDLKLSRSEYLELKAKKIFIGVEGDILPEGFLKNLGSTLVSRATDVGEGLVDGASKVGGGLATVGGGFVDGVKKVGTGVADVGKFVVDKTAQAGKTVLHLGKKDENKEEQKEKELTENKEIIEQDKENTKIQEINLEENKPKNDLPDEQNNEIKEVIEQDDTQKNTDEQHHLNEGSS